MSDGMIPIAGGLGVSAIVMIGAIAGDIAGVPFALDGDAATVAIYGMVVACLGGAWAAVQFARHGAKVTHVLDGRSRKLLEQLLAKRDDDPPG